MFSIFKQITHTANDLSDFELRILRRKDRGSRAIPKEITYHEKVELIPRVERVRSAEKLPSETLEQVLREAEDLLGEDNDH